MEAFGMYLLKSVIWLTGFALIFIFFLRNERFFFLNRFYLIAGILASLFLPFLTVRYQVTLPEVPVSNVVVPVIIGSTEAVSGSSFETGTVLLALYICGIISVLAMTLLQSRRVIKAIKKAEVIVSGHPAKLIRTNRYSTSFTFFSYVFVNPSVTDAETEEILNHELVHISQKHWIDLVLAEMLCVLQWFNPLAWIYFRLIRQNHEYLADEVALQRTSDPAIYKATLLNQIVGAPVVNLSNSFNYSLNKKRFNMMKNIITSPYRKMKILLILPVFAIVLWSFAEPEYKFHDASEGTLGNENPAFQEKKEVKGKVVESNGTPLPGASVVLRGTTQGTKSDSEGNFRLEGVPADGELILSFVGYKFKVAKAVFTSEMTIKMEQDTVKLNRIGVPPPPPPPPPPGSSGSKNTPAAALPGKPSSGNSAGVPPPPPPPPPPSSSEQNGKYLEDYVKIVSKNGQKPLILVNGIEYDIEKIKLDPASIESIAVLKDESATAVYGEKGKNGVIIITLKDAFKDSENKVVTVTGYGQQKTPPPPPPPSEFFSLYSQSGQKPLFVVDGKISEKEPSDIDPISIESVSVLKGVSATKLYGEQGKDGVIIIVTKGNNTKTKSGNEPVTVTGYGTQKNANGDTPVIVEEMPLFPGGTDAMKAWIYGNIKIQKGMDYKTVTEPIYVIFTVGVNGKVGDVKIKKSVSPLFDAEAVRVVSSMPDWKPGSQNGKPVAVRMQLPIDFNMKVQVK